MLEAATQVTTIEYLLVAVAVVGLFGVCEYFPQQDSECPDVALGRVSAVANRFQRHPAQWKQTVAAVVQLCVARINNAAYSPENSSVQ